MGRLVIILLLLAMVAIVTYFENEKYKDQMASGEIRKRDDIFIRQEHHFFFSKEVTRASFLSVLDQIGFDNRFIVLEEVGHDHLNFNITRQCPKQGQAQWCMVFSQDGREAIYYFNKSTNLKLKVIRYELNLILTRIEEACKQLDDQVEVQRTVSETHITRHKVR